MRCSWLGFERSFKAVEGEWDVFTSRPGNTPFLVLLGGKMSETVGMQERVSSESFCVGSPVGSEVFPVLDLSAQLVNITGVSRIDHVPERAAVDINPSWMVSAQQEFVACLLAHLFEMFQAVFFKVGQLL